jgi:hypothetical protein
MVKNIASYIESKRDAWSPSTIKTAHSKLRALEHSEVLALNPKDAYTELVAQGMKPYTIKTAFILMHGYEVYRSGDSKWQVFTKTHARLFKNAYQKEQLNVTFEQAMHLIEGATFTTIGMKQTALLMLTAGLRSMEALAYDGSGKVVGKGGKVRSVFTQITKRSEGNSYRQLYSELRGLGLKPHMLRKLAATRLAEQGFTLQDIMTVMGWTNMQTAASYLQPSAKAILQAKVIGSLANVEATKTNSSALPGTSN